MGIEVVGDSTWLVMPEKKEVRVDNRGRVVVPSEMREEVGSPSHFIARLTEGGTVELVPARLEPLGEE